MKLALASTLHNPNDEMLPILQKTMIIQKFFFTSLNVVATKDTHKNLLSYLFENVNLKIVESKDGGSSGHRKHALKLALKNSPKAKYLFYVDYDRLLHWITNYENELKDLISSLPLNNDFCLLGEQKEHIQPTQKSNKKQRGGQTKRCKNY